MNKSILYSILFLFSTTSLLTSCIEDDKYGGPLSVYNQGDNRRGESLKIEDDEEVEEEEEFPEGPEGSVIDTTKAPEENNDFLALSGVYEGLLISGEGEERTEDPLDVTVETKDNLFKLALYDANVQGIALGDLILENIPAKKSAEGYTFALEGIDVTLADGALEATVDVDGEVSTTGNLKFSVKIQTPPIELSYEGTKKK
jgi:hypothetical protein